MSACECVVVCVIVYISTVISIVKDSKLVSVLLAKLKQGLNRSQCWGMAAFHSKAYMNNT